MRVKNHYTTLITIFAFLMVFSMSCKEDSTGPDIDLTVPAPSFSIASTTVQEDGLTFVLFWFTPSEDIELGRTEIKNPTGDNFLFSGQNQLFIGGESYYMDAYLRISGNWTFRFVGKSSPGDNAFDVRTVVSVGAKELPN